MERLLAALLLAAAGAMVISVGPSQSTTLRLAPAANAAEEPRVIEIKAKKFEFTPNEITLKKGEPVILRLTSEDRVHGFLLKPLKIDTDIDPKKPTDVAVTPGAAGEYTIICDHYCGTGHGNMKVKLTVVE
jgi:cytochrome c oxidase subunit II